MTPSTLLPSLNLGFNLPLLHPKNLSKWTLIWLDINSWTPFYNASIKPEELTWRSLARLRFGWGLRDACNTCQCTSNPTSSVEGNFSLGEAASKEPFPISIKFNITLRFTRDMDSKTRGGSPSNFKVCKSDLIVYAQRLAPLPGVFPLWSVCLYRKVARWKASMEGTRDWGFFSFRTQRRKTK